ncbi:probable Phosphoserine phosphatase [Rhynchosporium agropyri]|uniref:Probable Phosphoserine phosphatase n=1 Tax=Rhynchosporium agropyri TaxID=914238 RepID=A0A1E1JTN3_9HELO|nr:probable Phosphoserine phosphatase [Rhynchosporium agropyri]
MASKLPAMATSPSYIFFTDFDGTITQRDSNDFLTDNLGYGQALRKQGNQDVLHDRLSFRSSFQDMMDSVTTPYDQCIKILLENIKLDVGFKEFFEWARSINMPVVVLSSGMEPIIRALLTHLVGKEADEIQIVSNDVAPREGKNINEEGGWQIVFHDDSHFGHDKSLEIRPYGQLPDSSRPIMFYAGDGVSDLSAAKETNLLFAKKGHDLITYCVRESVPFTVFEDWSTILADVKKVVAGTTTVQELSASGLAEYKKNASENEPTVK